MIGKQQKVAREEAAERLLLQPGHIDAHGDFVFDRDGEKRWTVDFEVGAESGNGSGDADGSAHLRPLKRHVRIVRGLSRELHFKVGKDSAAEASD